MKFFINKSKRKIFIFDFLGLILLISLIAGGIFYFMPPEHLTIQERDNEREADLQSILTKLEEYSTQNGKEGFTIFKNCAEGYTTFDESMKDKFGLENVTDPLGEGYEVCTSFDKGRIELRAPKAELEQISLGKRIIVE